MKLRSAGTLLLLLANGFAAGMILARYVQPKQWDPSDFSAQELVRIGRQLDPYIQDTRGQVVVFAFFRDICSSCPSGAAMDSLMEVSRSLPETRLFMVGDYTRMDAENLERLWRPGFPVQPAGATLTAILAPIAASQFFLVRFPHSDAVKLLSSVYELSRLLP